MARYAIIKGGAAVNIIEADADFAASIGAVLASSAAIGDLYTNGKFSKPLPPPLDKSSLVSQIDSAVEAIYERPIKLSKEYEGREKAATDFKAAGYLGVVPPRLQSLVTASGMTPKAAADLVLTQATQLRTALDQLSDLRMQKLLIQRAPTDSEAKTAFDETMKSISLIASSLA